MGALGGGGMGGQGGLSSEVGVVLLITMLGWGLWLGVRLSSAVSFYEGGSYALLLKVRVVVFVAMDLHAPATTSAEPDPACAVIDVPLMLVIAVEELALDRRRRKASAVQELMSFLALPLGLGELSSDVYVLES